VLVGKDLSLLITIKRVNPSIVVSVRLVPDMAKLDIVHLSGNKQGMSKRILATSVDTRVSTKNSFQYTMLMQI